MWLQHLLLIGGEGYSKQFIYFFKTYFVLLRFCLRTQNLNPEIVMSMTNTDFHSVSYDIKRRGFALFKKITKCDDFCKDSSFWSHDQLTLKSTENEQKKKKTEEKCVWGKKKITYSEPNIRFFNFESLTLSKVLKHWSVSLSKYEWR